MLKFATFVSSIELPFWASLAAYKINEAKLDDSPQELVGFYELRSHEPPESSCRMQVAATALTSGTVPNAAYIANGVIRNVNTIEEFRNIDKTPMMMQAAQNIVAAIDDGSVFACPSLLCSFVILCFADIKKYAFTYLCAFPALHSEPAWLSRGPQDAQSLASSAPGSSTQHCLLEEADAKLLARAVKAWQATVDVAQRGFFLAKRAQSPSRTPYERHGSPGISKDNDDVSEKSNWQIERLAGFEKGFLEDAAAENRYICFADPSTYPEFPGWMLRNLLLLVQRRWEISEVQVLCYRDSITGDDAGKSLVFSLETRTPHGQTLQQQKPQSTPRVSGWERNAAGKVTSKLVQLGDYLDPTRLADQAVDLNLKLMKWRIAPSLDIDIIKHSRCLLLGAGTLGTYVSRNLMGWGVRRITFVDNGTVSFSNPVRQPLFKHEDCLSGGAKKATQAAQALKEVYPGVLAEGHVMSVPMAGHPIVEEATSKADFERLERLINEHDAIFLLMDSRESRWLPTVMGKAAGKLVFNAALGFDTFVVMRHGTQSDQDDKMLGCYFCNDVVAPTDSLSDRSLDQQCTVTRPGIAAIASALLVELFVSVLQHPAGASAPASSAQEPATGHPLGVIPHQIRGYLSEFQNIVVRGKAYENCSACSGKVLAAYREGQWQFVRRALTDISYVEEVSGLAEVQRSAENMMREIEAKLSDSEDDEELQIL